MKISLLWEICLQMVAVVYFALKKILLVQKENEFSFCEVFIVQHLLEHILGLNQPICVGILPQHLRTQFRICSQSKSHLIVLGDCNEEDDCCDIVKLVDPLLPIVPLPSHVDKDQGHLFTGALVKGETVLHNPCGLLSSQQNILTGGICEF